MTATTRVRLGRSGVEVTALGFGGATIGGLFRRIPEAQVQETLAAAFEAGIGLFDTAPLYGHGQSELRLGYQLRQRDLGDTVLATKVGRVLQRPRTRPREVDLGGWSGRGCPSNGAGISPTTASCAPTRTACSGSASTGWTC